MKGLHHCSNYLFIFFFRQMFCCCINQFYSAQSQSVFCQWPTGFHGVVTKVMALWSSKVRFILHLKLRHFTPVQRLCSYSHNQHHHGGPMRIILTQILDKYLQIWQENERQLIRRLTMKIKLCSTHKMILNDISFYSAIQKGIKVILCSTLRKYR